MSADRKRIEVEWTETVEYRHVFDVDAEFDENDDEAVEELVTNLDGEAAEDAFTACLKRETTVVSVQMDGARLLAVTHPTECATCGSPVWDMDQRTDGKRCQHPFHQGEVQRWAVKMHHDQGEVTINVPARSEEMAAQLVCAAESAPRRSVLSVELAE